MQKEEIPTNFNDYSHAVEFIMIDEYKKERRALVLFNTDDEWRAYDSMTESDIEGMFAGHIMEIGRKDKSALTYKATSYKISNNQATRSIYFTPFIRQLSVENDGTMTSKMVCND